MTEAFMYRLLILADDLTGALDTGVCFAEAGIPTAVYPSPVFQEAEFSGCGGSEKDDEVLVINTDSRHCSAGEARSRILALRPIITQVPYCYKKTDSTLRGHIGAELEALMETAGILRLPFIPAYPDLGRTTVAGQQLLQGVPIDKTAMAADPLNPISKSYVSDIIHEESRLPVRLISPESDESWKKSLDDPQDDSETDREIMVFDCRTNDDMNSIGDFLKKHEHSTGPQGDPLRFTAGCAGFAGTLMRLLPLSRSERIRADDYSPPKMPLLAVSGSLHRISAEQIRNAGEAGLPVEFVSSAKLLEDGWLLSEEARVLAGKIRGHLRGRRVCILSGAGDLKNEALQESGQSPEHIARNLAEFAAAVIAENDPVNLAVFGGDTLLSLMRTLGCNHIVPIKEIEPGIVLAEARGRHKNITLVTKSGAFGRAGSLVNIVSYMTNGCG
jgi:uncharacterized protein YgbK (DUF1537 family)